MKKFLVFYCVFFIPQIVLGETRPFSIGFMKLSPYWDSEKPLAALDPSGWEFIPELDGVIGSPLAGELAAFSFKSKGPIWRTKIAGGDLTTPVYRSQDLVFFGTRDSHIYAVRWDTGAILWKTPLDRFASRALVGDGDSLFAVSGSQTLYSLNLKDGKILWSVGNPGDQAPEFLMDSQPPPLIWEGALYLGTSQGEILSLDQKTGQELWRKDPGSEKKGSGIKSFVGKLGVSHQTLYFARHDGILGGVSLTAPHPLVWLQGEPYSFTTSDIRGSTLYVGSQKGDFFAWDLLGKKILWKNYFDSSISMGHGGEDIVYIGISSGTVLACNDQTGQVLWFKHLGSPVSRPPIYRGQEVYFGTGYKNLYGFQNNKGEFDGNDEQKRVSLGRNRPFGIELK
jgi:outer membrane protein assembly factor BamB